MAEGQTATNPQTGERVILRGGQWVPLGGASLQSPRQAVSSLSNPVASITQAAGGARISSGYRDPARNRAAGGVANSYHTRGQALDLVPQQGETMAQLEARLRQSGLPLRELLNEGDHVHVAWEGEALSPDMTADYFARQGRVQPEAQMMSAPVQTATNPQTGETLSLVNGQWVPTQAQGPIDVEIDQGVQNINGRAILGGQDMGPWEQYQAGLLRSQADRLARVEREADPQYQAAMADARRGSENVPERLRAFTQGGALGLLDEAVGAASYIDQGLINAYRNVTRQPIEYSASMAAQAARDSERDAQNAYAAANPLENFALQTAGGLITPGLSAGGSYISGAQGAGRIARAAQVGGAYGAASGLGYGEGNLIDRAPSVTTGALVGAGVGAIGQAGVDRLMRGAATPRPASAARRLSREGVELTPGQMVAEIPMVGPALRTIEEGASTIPIAGAAISGARNRSIETFNRAAINRALAPIGEALPTNVRAFTRPGRQNEAGYEAVDRASRLVSNAYDKALEGVDVRPDQQFYDDLAQVSTRIAEEAPESVVGQFGNIIQNRAFRNMEFADSPITGQQFKRADSEIAALAREQRISNDPANRALARALDDTREVLRNLVARQNPDKAPEIQAANRAFANLVRVQEAAGSTASQAAEGVFSPTQLGVAAARGQSRGNRASGNAMMQDLAASGRQVLNSRIGDSGTATRGAVTAMASGAAGAGTMVNPAVAVPVIAGVSAVYSRPAQALLNAAYRATDSRAASEALQELARLAQRDPALIPYYEGAVQHVLGLFQPDRPTVQPAQPSAQAPSPAIQRVLQ